MQIWIIILLPDSFSLIQCKDTERLRNTPSPTAHQNESEVKVSGQRKIETLAI